jgi:hypothetical protein
MVWIGVEMWERGTPNFDSSTKIGCPIFGAVLSRLRWAIVRRTIRHPSSEPGYPDWAGFAQKIVRVTRPGPILGSFDKITVLERDTRGSGC